TEFEDTEIWQIMRRVREFFTAALLCWRVKTRPEAIQPNRQRGSLVWSVTAPLLGFVIPQYRLVLVSSNSRSTAALPNGRFLKSWRKKHALTTSPGRQQSTR
ncbi:unnamed protein product, partial [Ectocarpus sp. 8 AP-2014]